MISNHLQNMSALVAEAYAASMQSPKSTQSTLPKNSEEGNEGPQLKATAAASSLRLSPEALQMIGELQKRDAEVRAHEAAHLAAAGPYAKGGPSFTYQQGPDGKSYAIGGSVDVDTSAESTPQETLQKAQVIRNAAMAPANPSAQDIAVAAKASQMAADAQRQIIEQTSELNKEEQNSPQRDVEPVSTGQGASDGGAVESPGYRVTQMQNAYQQSRNFYRR